jgi:hypothetical protein
MQRSVEALLEAFPYSICQEVGGLPFLGIRTFLHRKWRSLLCAFLQQYMQLLYYCWNNLKTNSLSVHNFQKFLKYCNNPICSVSIDEHDTIEKVMLLQFLDVIFKLMANFGMWTDQKHFGDARHRWGGLYFILHEFVMHN